MKKRRKRKSSTPRTCKGPGERRYLGHTEGTLENNGKLKGEGAVE